MGNESFTNLLSLEDTTVGESVVSFSLRVRRVTITNDSSSKDLGFRFKESGMYSTLKPTETVSMEMTTREVYLNGDTVPYRVWGIG